MIDSLFGFGVRALYTASNINSKTTTLNLPYSRGE